MSDLVKSPNHYKQMACVIEPIEVTYAMHSCLGQVLQYILRYRLKGNPVQDLQKAKFGLEWFHKRYFVTASRTSVKTMAADCELDNMLRSAFRAMYRNEDPLISSAIKLLLQPTVGTAEINKMIKLLDCRIAELEAEQ